MDSESNAPGDNDHGSSWLTQKVYESDAEKKKDRWIGIGLFFGLNILLWLCRWGISLALFGLFSQSGSDFGDNLSTIAWIVLSLLPWVINFGLLLYFAFTRGQIAWGMLLGFAIALALVVVLGLVFMVACFVIIGLSAGASL